MSQVTVVINARQYRMGCEDGEEDHLMTLARDFDRRIEGMRRKFGEVGDMRLSIMAALTLSDELTEMKEAVRRLEQEVTTLREAQQRAAQQAQATEAAIVAAFNSAAERIETVTGALNRAPSSAAPARG
jgi:cell division protein ZapA